MEALTGTLQSWLADPTIGKLLTLVLGILLTVTAVRLVNRSLARMIQDSEARYRARKLATFAGYGIVIILVLTIYSGRFGGLTVVLGVAGAGIAFALQEVIASFAGWFAIALSGFYRTGDRVQLGGIKGDVIDIGVLRTTLMEVGEWVKGDLYSGRVVRIANSFVFKEPVFNYSGEFPFLWDEITLPVKYGTDWKLASSILDRVAREVVGEYTDGAARAWREITRTFLVEDAIVEPMVSMVANDNWIEFTLRYVVDYKSRRRTKTRLFSRLLEEIEASEGRVAIASATFHLVETPVFDVRLRGGTDGGAPPS
ncbi:MAG: mechanosensitive ion channel family protein [Gemmatimonadales bacterium]|nr:mechanosensitive ion channel family protein [Gemmatimonadales bacterium]